jgi:methyltransferase (TIGR00027 family)
MVAYQQPPAGVGLTALGVARARANESARPDRLFFDPYARDFVGAGAPALADQAAAAGASVTGAAPVDLRGLIDAYAAIRTRFFDDYLLQASTAGIRQVAVLGAGLDTRAYRLAWPDGTQLFELDTQDVFRFKEPVLQARAAAAACQRAVVPVDLRDDWPAAIGAAGFDPGQPTAWLLEGLLMYLGEADRDLLLDRVGHLSASGSQLGLEPPGWTIPASFAPSVALGRADQSFVEQLLTLSAAARSSEVSVADPVAWLAGHGWRAQLRAAQDQFFAYGRSAPALFGNLRRYLATARRTRG